MAPRDCSTVPADSATKGAQSKRRWQFPDSKTSADVTTSTSVSKKLKQSHLSSPTPTRLLDLDTALVLQIAKAVGQEDLPKLMRTCQALWTIGLDALYNDQVRFNLGPRFPPSDSLVGYGPTFRYIHRFTRDVTIGITARSGAQDYFQMLAPTLEHTSLTSLIFTQPGLSDEHQQGPTRSALNGQSWLILEDMLCNDIRGLNLRDSLRNIDLPEVCDPPTTNSSGQHIDDTLLDSRLILKFVSTLLQPGKPFRFAAAGSKETGALRRVARRLLEYVGVGAHIESFYMRGSEPGKDKGIYRNPFLDLGLEQKFALTKLVFHDFCFRDLPASVAHSVDLSSVRSLRLIQCLDPERLFFYFMESDYNSKINIEDLCIQILNWDEPLLWRTHDFAFTNFITSFNSLQSVCMKVCNTWVGARSEYPRLIDIWRYHPGLRVYDVDFGNENDLSLRDMDSLASYCPGLEVFGSRDIVLGTPIYDGEWSEFDDEAPYITETLAAEFRELKTWKVYYNTGPLFKNEEGDDFHHLVATCLFDFFREACEEYKIECKLKTIILIAQDDVIPDHIFLRDGLSQGLTYNF
ncbi:uncharacterized protein J4E88_002577 [Alternaria novae-zelandiae]|uniref:uncharacterized protein n=1 Tax=Alternaria novae-zelandiae TaxID=430562 RepID=UPI0020C584D0|nr:uncharacterized protein J4E88_002577 [Alternaria novae-zelandiae]KAI4689227.1 hypothetical protein J4E88_002577 [Alternaria novae-zelandiae]